MENTIKNEWSEKRKEYESQIPPAFVSFLSYLAYQRGAGEWEVDMIFCEMASEFIPALKQYLQDEKKRILDESKAIRGVFEKAFRDI